MLGTNMEVSIETLEGLQRKMLVVIPASRVEEKVNQKLAEAANSTLQHLRRRGTGSTSHGRCRRFPNDGLHRENDERKDRLAWALRVRRPCTADGVLRQVPAGSISARALCLGLQGCEQDAGGLEEVAANQNPLSFFRSTVTFCARICQDPGRCASV